MKNKGFTIINVLGLALGLCVCLLIVFYVTDELSYDRYNTKLDRMYRINNNIKFGGNANNFSVAPAPLAAELTADFPEVETAVRFRQRGGYQVKKGSQNIHENSMLFSDPTVFSVFTLPMLHGDPNTALKDPNTAVISESMAKKYFNTADAVGRTLVFNDTINYKVTGVIKDMPKQSHFTCNFFLSMSTLAESRDDSWINNNFQTYVVLKPGVDIKTLQPKLDALIKRKLNEQLQPILHQSYEQFAAGGNYFKLLPVALKDIHLRSNAVAELDHNGNIQYIYIFSAIALFVLLIACINFMNLSTARSANRAREVGVRKVLGSARKFLIAQFLSESMLVTLTATIIALVAAWALLPVFNQMSGKQLSITAHDLLWLIPAVLVIVAIVGCMAGSYPAFYLSSFQPVDVLKGKLSGGFKRSWLRSFLVIFQFSISIFLIIGTLVIYNQLKYIQNKDLGYNREHVLVVNNIYLMGKQAKAFKEEIKRMPAVVNATQTGFTPTMDYRNSSSLFKDAALTAKDAVFSQVWSVDEDYLTTMGMKVARGRNFSKDMLTDSSAMIINQTAAEKFGFKDPINQLIYVPQDSKAKVMKAFRIVGVVKDFNFSSLKENVSPLVLTYFDDAGALNIRVSSNDMQATLRQIEAKWKSFAPNQEFKYSFMDQDFDASYRAEQRTGSIAISFTALAIIIACLGLFGLAAYAAEQRTKEIGIRKVLGANISSIVSMLSVDFVKLVIVSIVVASPVAWLLMNMWLHEFAYRQNIQWWVIAVAGAAAIIIAFVTISFQSIKAALLNPVKSLRSE